MPILTITPSGPLSLIMQRMASILSQSESLQTILGVNDLAAALAKIDYPEWESTSQENPIYQIPNVIVSHQDGLLMLVEDSGAAQAELLVSFDFPLIEDHSGNIKDQTLAYMNTIGAIFADIYRISGRQTLPNENNLTVNSIQNAISPQVTDPDTDATEDGESFLTSSWLFNVRL